MRLKYNSISSKFLQYPGGLKILSKEDQIIEGNVVKDKLSEDHSLRVSMENVRLRDDGYHT